MITHLIYLFKKIKNKISDKIGSLFSRASSYSDDTNLFVGSMEEFEHQIVNITTPFFQHPPPKYNQFTVIIGNNSELNEGQRIFIFPVYEFESSQQLVEYVSELLKELKDDNDYQNEKIIVKFYLKCPRRISSPC